MPVTTRVPSVDGAVPSHSLSLTSFGSPPPPCIRGTGETYLRTGDRCHIDADGLLHIEGRIKDLIIINGRNIYPQVIVCA